VGRLIIQRAGFRNGNSLQVVVLVPDALRFRSGNPGVGISIIGLDSYFVKIVCYTGFPTQVGGIAEVIGRII
jgi:hypothetical protein